jgi:hypothetical protein
MLSSTWGIFFVPIVFFLVIALYLALSYFYQQYKEATTPETQEPKEVDPNAPNM